jgi:FtsZ-binding cell division protein ZapB
MYSERVKLLEEVKAVKAYNQNLVQQNRKAMAKLKDENDRIKEENKANYQEAIRELAKTLDIAINPRLASQLRCWHVDFKDNPQALEDLQAYENACDAYAAIQHIFDAFYNSGTFKNICNQIHKNEIELSDYNMPRPANHRYRDSSGNIEQIRRHYSNTIRKLITK